MEKRRKPIQIYAMIVNVVAIIAFLIAGTSAISALIDRSNPLYAGYSQVDLSSFEKYKSDILANVSKDAAFVPSDDDIMKMYEAAKQDKINKVMHVSNRNIMVSSITLIVSVILFATHWWLMRKYGDQ